AFLTRVARRRSFWLEKSVRTAIAVPMANDPPFATLNHVAGDLGIPSESALLRIGITHPSNRVCKRSISAADTSAVCDQHWVEEKRGIASHLPRAAIWWHCHQFAHSIS